MHGYVEPAVDAGSQPELIAVQEFPYQHCDNAWNCIRQEKDDAEESVPSESPGVDAQGRQESQAQHDRHLDQEHPDHTPYPVPESSAFEQRYVVGQSNEMAAAYELIPEEAQVQSINDR